MIELDVATRRKPVAVAEQPPSNYLVLGDFGGCAPGPILVDRETIDAAMSRMDVRIGALPFHKMEDFHPDHLCRRAPLLRSAPSEWSSPETQSTNGPFREHLQELARAYARHQQSAPGDASPRYAELGGHMRRILHHPEFQEIESVWRGLDFLLGEVNKHESANSTGNGVHIYIAQYSREDANRELPALALDPPAGAAAEPGTRIQELLNARRWRAIAGLYTFGPAAFDIQLLRQMALLAAQARAPFVSAWPAAGAEANMGPDWGELTAMPEADHLGLALPRFLLRLPYGEGGSPIDSFPFEEMLGDPVPSRYLWGNPALACLSLLARGGEALDVTGLPLHVYEKEGKVATAPCAETPIAEVRELALIEAGLMPLVPSAKSDSARLAGFRAINGKELPVAP